LTLHCGPVTNGSNATQKRERKEYRMVATVHSIAHSKVGQSLKKQCLKCGVFIQLEEAERSNAS